MSTWWRRRLSRRVVFVAAAVLVVVLGAAYVVEGRSLVGRGRHSSDPGRTAGVARESGDPAARAAALVARLSDEDLVGQVFMPFAYGDDATTVSSASAAANRAYAGVDTPAALVAKYRVGGVILMGQSANDPTAATNKTSNIDSPAQVRRLTAGLQTAAASLAARAPLLIGTDQEYGTVTRIRDGMLQLPSAMALGAAGDPALTENAWRAAGGELAALGVNLDFAPVADVLDEATGGAGRAGASAGAAGQGDGAAGAGVIGSRSFGSDAAAVSAQTMAAVRGLESAGVAAAAKHFPGHGRTSGDSHTELPVLTQDRAALDRGDLPPFAAAVRAGASVVMSGHLDVQALDPGVPASFSSRVLIDLLRGELGFEGVVISDALNMAPAKRWPAGEAAVRALVAGNDLLLVPPDLPAARTGLLSGLHSGVLPRQRLVEAATRVLTLRLRLAARTQPAMSTLNEEGHRRAAAQAAAAAVTVLRGRCGGAQVTGPVRVTTSAGRDRQRDWLREALKARGAAVTDSGGTHVHLVGYGDAAADLAGDAAVTVAMDTPYLLAAASSPTLLATFSSTQASMEALAAVLTGAARAPGRSPVPVAGLPRSVCGDA